MIPRFLTPLLLRLDGIATAYLVARGVSLAPTADAQSFPVACDGCGAGIGQECAPTCPHLIPPGARDDRAAYHSLPTHGEVLAMPGHIEAERRVHPSVPPVVACCYCGGKRLGTWCIDDDGKEYPLCKVCFDEASTSDILAKVRADRERALALEDLAPGEVLPRVTIDDPALPRCGVPDCKSNGCQR